MFSKIAKTLIAGLVVASTLAAATTVYAAPNAPTKAEQNWMNRASQNVDGGGN